MKPFSHQSLITYIFKPDKIPFDRINKPDRGLNRIVNNNEQKEPIFVNKKLRLDNKIDRILLMIITIEGVGMEGVIMFPLLGDGLV